MPGTAAGTLRIMVRTVYLATSAGEAGLASRPEGKGAACSECGCEWWEASRQHGSWHNHNTKITPAVHLPALPPEAGLASRIKGKGASVQGL